MGTARNGRWESQGIPQSYLCVALIKLCEVSITVVAINWSKIKILTSYWLILATSYEYVRIHVTASCTGIDVFSAHVNQPFISTSSEIRLLTFVTNHISL